MKVKVKLYGTLSERFPGYQPSQGIEIEIPDGTTARDLLALLEISESQGAVVIVEGRIIEADDAVQSGAAVSVVQTIHGG